ncbi:MAG: radical SAM protein [Terrisporobacter sp.]
MFVKWNITSKCNLNCLHCCVSGGAIDSKELTTKEVSDIITNLKSNEDTLKYIHFLGGEPFSRQDINEILQHCVNNKIGIGITTNGTYKMKYLYDLLDKNSNYPLVIFFSLDGPNQSTNDKIRGKNIFNQCIENIRKISKYKKDNPNLYIGISATINKLNKDNIEDYMYLTHSNQVDIISFSFIDKKGNASINYDNLKIDKIDKIKSIHTLAKEYAKFDTFSLQLPINNKAAAYLDKLYGSSINNSNILNRGSNCMAIDGGFIIDNKGFISSCEYIDGIMNSNTINKFKLDISEYKSLSKNKFLLEQNKFLLNKIQEQNKLFSNKACDFAKLCSVCPLKTEEDLMYECILCNKVCEYS